MKVRKLIEMLQEADQDAEVMMHDHKEYGGYDTLFVLWRMSDPKCVWIESKKDCDFPYQLGCHFDDMAEKDNLTVEDWVEFYKDLVDRGVTIDEVREYVSEIEADRMEGYCQDYNLI